MNHQQVLASMGAAGGPVSKTYVVVGATGLIRTSTDTNSWTARTSGVTSTINTVAYGNGQFIAGTTNNFLVSSDAITWTAYATPVTTTIRGIVYSPSLGLWAAIGSNNRILTSSNGTSWTTRTYTGDQVSGFNSITWTGSEFYAVNGSLVSPLRQIIVTSSNGTSWASSSIGNNDDTLNSVTSNGINTIAAGFGNWLGQLYPTVWLNGTRYQVTTTALETAYSVAYSGSLYVVSGDNYTWYSTNGTSWTQSSGTTPRMRSLWWDGTQFIGAGFSGAIATSTDGNTWTSKTSGTTSSLISITSS